LFHEPQERDLADDEDEMDFSLVSADHTIDLSGALFSTLIMETPLWCSANRIARVSALCVGQTSMRGIVVTPHKERRIGERQAPLRCLRI
jgi:hypothetical protein